MAKVATKALWPRPEETVVLMETVCCVPAARRPTVTTTSLPSTDIVSPRVPAKVTSGGLAVYQLTKKIVFTGPPAELAPGEQGWKDTGRVDPITVTRIIVKFEGFAGRYVWRCHLLEHEDNEMMRPYIITPCEDVAKNKD